MGMPSKARFVPDAAYALRAASAAALTADTVISAGELVSPNNANAPWNDEMKDGKVVIAFKASEQDNTTADETYVLEVITSANADLSSAVVHVSKDVKSLVGFQELLIDQYALLAAQPTHKYWGININVGGTTPSIKFEAYVLPPYGK